MEEQLQQAGKTEEHTLLTCCCVPYYTILLEILKHALSLTSDKNIKTNLHPHFTFNREQFSYSLFETIMQTNPL